MHLAVPGGRPLLAFLVLAFLLGATGGPLRGLIAVYVESQLRRPPAFSSALLALLLAGSGAFAVPAGALADRLGHKAALVAGMFWLPLAAILYLVQAPPVLFCLALGMGLVDGLQIVGGQGYLVAITPRSAIGLASALYYLGSTLGTSLGSLGAGAVVERWGFGALGTAALLASAALIAAAARFLPRTRVKERSAGNAVTDVLGTYLRLGRQRDFLLIVALRFLPTCYWGVATLLMPLLLFRLSGSVMAVSLYAAVSLIVAAACQLLTGRISDRFSKGLPVVVLGALLPLAAVSASLAAGSFPALFAAGVFGTAVAWSISVNFPPLVRELTPEGEHGRALGLLHLLWVLAMLLGTAAGGTLVQMDPRLPFALGAAVNVPTALAGIGLWRRLRRPQINATAV